MKLIDITNSNRELVQNQLDHTDATFIKVYTYGQTTIIYSKAPKHFEILYRNKRRNIQRKEIEETLPKLITDNDADFNHLDTIRLSDYVEISIPRKQKEA